MIFNNGAFIKVDPTRCLNHIHIGVNCSHCISHCPCHALGISTTGIKLDKQNCFGCGLCFSECPTQVFSESQWDETTIIG